MYQAQAPGSLCPGWCGWPYQKLWVYLFSVRAGQGHRAQSLPKLVPTRWVLQKGIMQPSGRKPGCPSWVPSLPLPQVSGAESLGQVRAESLAFLLGPAQCPGSSPHSLLSVPSGLLSQGPSPGPYPLPTTTVGLRRLWRGYLDSPEGCCLEVPVVLGSEGSDRGRPENCLGEKYVAKLQGLPPMEGKRPGEGRLQDWV
jgi:hypothetical protein